MAVEQYKTLMKTDLELFSSIVNELLQEEKEHPVAEYLKAEEMFRTVDLSLNDAPMDEEAFKASLTELVKRTPKTATPAFFNQLFGGRKGKAILGELLAVMLNNSMYTYKVGGPMIGMEQAVLNEVARIAGYPETYGGTFAPGGSMSNMMGMIMARDRYHDDIRMQGVTKRMIAYTSAESHYSVPKNAAFTGIGRENVRYVDTDKQGRMLPEHLEQLIKEDLEEGNAPFMVNVTAGTTVLGSFDPIEQIAAVTKNYKLWLHVDGAYGGTVIFSDKYKHLIKGLELSDSFSVNAHKTLGTPLSCSMFFAKDKRYLYDSFSSEASYLYQTDADDLNPGKTSIQCGRRNDGLKFWTLWKAVGTKGLTDIVDHEFALADHARDYVRSKPEDYTFYSYDESIAVCFNYKGISAKKLCTALYEHAELMVGYGSFGDDEFVRLVMVNSENSFETIDAFFTTLENFVEDHADLFPEAHTTSGAH